MRPRKEELQDKHWTELATLCEEVAGNPACDPRIAEKAQALRLECVLLAASQGQRLHALKKRNETEPQELSLKKRIIEFLMHIPE
jgi:hypothetical protein